MRTTVLLSLFLLLIVAGCNRQPQQQAAAQPEYQLDYPIEEIMEHIVMPNADLLWGSVQTSVSEKGIDETIPRTNDDWDRVKHYAVTIVEATNLLLMPGRVVARPGAKAEAPGDLEPDQIEARIKQDPAMWKMHVHELHDAAMLSVKAVDQKSVDGLLKAGDTLDKVCESCHKIYWYPPAPGTKS